MRSAPDSTPIPVAFVAACRYLACRLTPVTRMTEPASPHTGHLGRLRGDRRARRRTVGPPTPHRDSAGRGIRDSSPPRRRPARSSSCRSRRILRARARPAHPRRSRGTRRLHAARGRVRRSRVKVCSLGPVTTRLGHRSRYLAPAASRVLARSPVDRAGAKLVEGRHRPRSYNLGTPFFEHGIADQRGGMPKLVVT